MSMKKHEAVQNQPKKQEHQRPSSPMSQMPPKPQNPPSTKR